MHQEDAAPVNLRAFSEKVGIGQAQELGGPDHFIPELKHSAMPVELQSSREHSALPVELQSSRSYRQDERGS